MRTTVLLAAAAALAAGCASSSGTAATASGAGMDIHDTNALISTRMNTIEAGAYRAALSSGHQIAGLEDKASEMEQKARRDAERRKNYRRTVPGSF